MAASVTSLPELTMSGEWPGLHSNPHLPEAKIFPSLPATPPPNTILGPVSKGDPAGLGQCLGRKSGSLTGFRALPQLTAGTGATYFTSLVLCPFFCLTRSFAP